MNKTKVALFRSESDGKILHTYFNDTAYDVPKNIFSWFSKDAMLHSALKETVMAGEHTVSSCDGKPMTLIIKPFKEGLLWHVDLLGRKPCVTTHRLLDVIVTQHNASLPDKKDSQYFFDSIQKMNNELVNKTREISKINRALNEANAVLNNRLVKDPLTHLISRYQYRDEMMHLIHKQPNKQGIFCFIDLDGFKTINDTYGHAFGDAYLVEVANRLIALPFNEIIAMRIAGDEFGLYIHGFDHVTQTELDTVENTLKAITDAPFVHNTIEITLKMSMGTAIYNQDTNNIHDLIDYADQAMYHAKHHKKRLVKHFSCASYHTVFANSKR